MPAFPDPHLSSKGPTDNPTRVPAEPPIRAAPKEVEDPPQYYDSEPSRQPPQYQRNGNSSNHTVQNETQTAGASAASVAAVLGLPSTALRKQLDEERKMKRTWRDRWRQWTTVGDTDYETSYESRPQWNVFGASLDWSGGVRSKPVKR
ncbi:hypothetical protein BDV95DRAFT_199432 [Massariosphaeria phaeospora]|uniref:Uncharacterized protein n=1 Tax=Massariosphaeria phaeospora TaxID=100035 RepID=A0A7C8I381_9PLEO|nr:hypothetical protein BDV95DRAFT_199432 [Massariosphaeria phaeospora]